MVNISEIISRKEIIGRVSRGSSMDQVYLPKTRNGLEPGSYVIITPLYLPSSIKKAQKSSLAKPCLYGIKEIEPLKIQIIREIFAEIESFCEKCENVIVTGSFLEKGFNFNDIDVLVITSEGLEIADKENIEKSLLAKLGIKVHILAIDNKSLIHGLETDPLYQMMLSRCIAGKRFLYRFENKPDYKLLDLHLLKSKMLIENFDILSGKEKYYLVRNLAAISIFLEGKKASSISVDKEIKRLFQIEARKIKENILGKKTFLEKYKKIYGNLFEKIMNHIKSEPEQK